MKKIAILSSLLLALITFPKSKIISQSNWEILGSEEPEKVNLEYEDPQIKIISLPERPEIRYSTDDGNTWKVITTSTSIVRRVRSKGDNLYIIAASDTFLLLNINSDKVVILDAEGYSWNADFWFEFFNGQIFLTARDTHYRFSLDGSLIFKKPYKYAGYYSMLHNNELYWISEWFGKTNIFKWKSENESTKLSEIKSKSKISSHTSNRLYIGKYVTDNFGAKIDSLPIIDPSKILNISTSNGKAVYKIGDYSTDTLHIFNHTTLQKKIITTSSNDFYFYNNLIYLNYHYCEKGANMIYNINTDVKTKYLHEANIKSGYSKLESHGTKYLVCDKCSIEDELDLTTNQWKQNKNIVYYYTVKHNQDTLLTINNNTVYASYNRGNDWLSIYDSPTRISNVASNNGIIVLSSGDSLIYTFDFFKTFEYRKPNSPYFHGFGSYKFEILPNGDVVSIQAFFEILCKYRYATNEVECDQERFHFSAITTRYDHNLYSSDIDYERKDDKPWRTISNLYRLEDNDLYLKLIESDTSSSLIYNYYVSPYGILLKYSPTQMWVKSDYNGNWNEVKIDINFIKIYSAIIDEQGILYVSTLGPGIIRYKTPFDARKAISINVLDSKNQGCDNTQNKEALIYKSFINEEGITALTDHRGTVRFTTPNENYTVKPTNTSQNMQLCDIDNEITGTITSNLTLDTTIVKSYDNCPYLTIDMSSRYLLNRCSQYRQYMVVRNEGQIPTTEQTIIKVSLNSELQVLRYDSIRFVSKDGNDYYFSLPVLEQSQKYEYVFYFKAPCEYINGNKFCNQVSIDQIGNLCANEKNILYQSCSELKDNNMNLLSVRYYLDTDLDCEKDPNEKTSNVKFRINDSLFVSNSNNYDVIYYTQEDSLKIVSEINTDLFTLCTGPEYYIFKDTTKYVNADFGIQAKKDCQNVEIHTTVFVRRCFQTSLCVNLKNTGTRVLNNKFLTIILDEKVEFISASLPYQIIGPNKIKVSINALYPLSQMFINIVIKDLCQSPLGTAYSFSYQFDGLQSQCSPTPLSGTSTVNSIGAYDPNDKTVIVNGEIGKPTFYYGDSIEYVVRFQNTGTDTAFNVTIEDDLSPAFDLTTLRPITASHPYIWSFRNNKIKVYFPNILLVDSFTNEPLSHGFIKFSIKLKPTATLGNTIKNKGAIFFDFNEPIITNETKTVIKNDVVNVNEANKTSVLGLNPNPTYDFITITTEKEEEDQIEIFNTHGAKVFAPLLGSVIDVRHINGGTYIVKLTRNGSIYIGRFVKM